MPRKGQTVTVHCTGCGFHRTTTAPLTQCVSYGKNKDLAVPFWSTKDAGQQPFSFQIGQGGVIKAWDEACTLLRCEGGR